MPTFIPWLRNRAEVKKKENSQDKKLIFVLLKSLIMSLLVNYNSFKYIGCCTYNNFYIKDYVKVKHNLKYVGQKRYFNTKKSLYNKY